MLSTWQRCMLQILVAAFVMPTAAVGSGEIIIVPPLSELQPQSRPSSRAPDISALMDTANTVGRGVARARAAREAADNARAEMQAGHKAVVVETWEKATRHEVDTTYQYETRVAGRGESAIDAMQDAAGPSLRPNDGSVLVGRTLFTSTASSGSNTSDGVRSTHVPFDSNSAAYGDAATSAEWVRMKEVGAPEWAEAIRNRAASDEVKANRERDGAALASEEAANNARLAREDEQRKRDEAAEAQRSRDAASRAEAEQARLSAEAARVAADETAREAKRLAEEKAKDAEDQRKRTEEARATAAVLECAATCETPEERKAANQRLNELMEQQERSQTLNGHIVAMCASDPDGGGGCGGVHPDDLPFAMGGAAQLSEGDQRRLRQQINHLRVNLLKPGELGILQRDGSLLIRSVPRSSRTGGR